MNRYLSVTARVIVGLVFVYAGGVKLFDVVTFSETIMNYRLVTPPVALVSAALLPAIEVVVGMFLIFGILRRGSLIISACLCIFFIFALSSLLIRGINVDCGCFAANSGTLTTPLTGVGKNLLLIALVVMAWSNAEDPNSWISLVKSVMKKKGGEKRERISVLP